MKIKNALYLALFVLIASFATVQQSNAQIPCGPVIIPKPTLFVNWPQYQYDAAHTGCNPYESILNTNTVANLAVEWTGHEAPRNTWSSPALANGVVYASSYSAYYGFGSVVALNANTGALIWGYGADYVELFGQPVVANGVVYAADDYSTVYALNATTGVLLWTYTAPSYIDGIPAVANGMVYVGTYYNGVYALNAATGALMWTYATAGPVTTSPAVSNGVVYAASQDQSIYALDATTGALFWKYVTANALTWTAVANGTVYTGSDGLFYNNTYALNAKTGQLLWMDYIPKFSPAIADGVLYAASSSAIGIYVYAVNASTGATIWKDKWDDLPSSTAIANGVLYVGSSTRLSALSAATGTLLWSYSVSGTPNFAPATVANGMVYVGTDPNPYLDEGYLYAFHLPASDK